MNSAYVSRAEITTYGDAISRLQSGCIGVLPTDTVYGVAAVAKNRLAVNTLYHLKHRERKPGTIIAASTQQLEELGISKNDLQKADKWWPGALSVVLDLQGTYAYLTQGLKDIAVRVVNDAAIRQVLEQTGPLLTSSANQPGRPQLLRKPGLILVLQ